MKKMPPRKIYKSSLTKQSQISRKTKTKKILHKRLSLNCPDVISEEAAGLRADLAKFELNAGKNCIFPLSFTLKIVSKDDEENPKAEWYIKPRFSFREPTRLEKCTEQGSAASTSPRSDANDGATTLDSTREPLEERQLLLPKVDDDEKTQTEPGLGPKLRLEPVSDQSHRGAILRRRRPNKSNADRHRDVCLTVESLPWEEAPDETDKSGWCWC